MNIGRAHLQPGDVAIVVDVRLPRGECDVEVRQDELPFQLGMASRIEQRDLEQVVAVEHLAGDADFVGDQPHRRDAAAFAVAAVLHLDGGLVDEPPAHRNRAGKAGDAATAFLSLLGLDRRPGLGIYLGPAGQQPLGEIAHWGTSSLM